MSGDGDESMQNLNAEVQPLAAASEDLEEYDLMVQRIQQRRDAGHHASVLVIDDEPMNNDILQALLFAQDLLCDSALSGREAIAMI